MSQSLDFCKWVAKERSHYGDRDFSKAYEQDAQSVFEQYTHGMTKYQLSGTKDDGTSVAIIVELDFNPNADFEYCTSASSCHDGSLLFLAQNLEECSMNVIQMRTYNKNVGEPQNGDHIKYTIGNFVVVVERDTERFRTDEKPWLTERTTVMLPLVMTKIKG